jgi:excisionase family DNA binding protein
MSPFLTAEEAAQRLGIRNQTLAVWRGRGMGPPFHKIGNRIRYREDDLELWLRSRVYASTSEYPLRRKRARGTRPQAACATV